MPAPDLFPIPFATLVARLDRELARGDAVYGLRRRDWWTPIPGRDTSLVHLGRCLATPAGPASGPHTQLAQNLVLSWLAGGRFLELKTVQQNDTLEIPRPCIHVPHVGYNVEWSQELRTTESAAEYVKGWMLVHFLASELGPGLWPAPDTAFDVSLGYDLAGIRTDKVRAYLDTMRDARANIAGFREELQGGLARWRDVEIPAQVSDALTLSTFHGCPADEIEAIAAQTLDWGWHTVVKLNPTLLGYARARQLLDQMGYDEGLVHLDPAAFEKDLQWEQLLAMVPRLRARARSLGLGFGLKLTNTLVMRSPEPPFGAGEAYLSGPPLHVLSMVLGSEVRAAFPDLPLTFSAGIEARNFAATVEAGLCPVTSCSDLLKGGGYSRMTRYVRGLEARIAEAGVADLGALRGGPAESVARLATLAKSLPLDTSYHRAQNATPPKKLGSHLELLDCVTCDKCIPVCPNAANFAFTVPTGRWQPGLLRWKEGSFELLPGELLKVEKRHQIGNCADACNLCGQCDPWCPEDGGPYLVKPNLFLSAASFEAHPERDGFLVSPDHRTIIWRQAGSLRTLSRNADGTARLRVGEGEVLLQEDVPLSTSGTGALDLRVATTLRLFLAAFTDSDAALWLAPLSPSDA